MFTSLAQATWTMQVASSVPPDSTARLKHTQLTCDLTVIPQGATRSSTRSGWLPWQSSASAGVVGSGVREGMGVRAETAQGSAAELHPWGAICCETFHSHLFTVYCNANQKKSNMKKANKQKTPTHRKLTLLSKDSWIYQKGKMSLKGIR